MASRRQRKRTVYALGRVSTDLPDFPLFDPSVGMDSPKQSQDGSEYPPKRSKEDEARLKEIQEGPMRSELKHIDRKVSDKGHIYYDETVEDKIPEQVDWWDKFALCLVRHVHTFGKEEHVIKTSLQVNSQHLKDILKRTIQDYPGVSFATKNIAIAKPYHVLFHYRRELEQAGKELEDASEAAAHHRVLLNFIQEEFKDCITETENLLEQGMISYEYLWTIFRPGSVLYFLLYEQPRAFVLRNYSSKYNALGEDEGFEIKMEYVDFDGDQTGTRDATSTLDPFTGSTRIVDMNAYPIEWHLDKDELKRQLVARGRVFEGLAGMHFRNYSGVALAGDGSRYSVFGRVAIDTKTFHRLNASYAFYVDEFGSTRDKAPNRPTPTKYGAPRPFDPFSIRELDRLTLKATEIIDHMPKEKSDATPLTDEQCMLATSMVRGFSFTEKEFFDFFIDRLTPIDWNPDCFDELVLPAAQKDLVKALVATHVQQSFEFDDIIKGKGKGLILVLHGPAGVGKTLTAETVAEYCKRPLYAVSSGDLGTYNSALLDKALSRITDLASTFKAILLIDEADVFLERRSLHDLARNSLVSIFLRELEHYQGILFLTTNRVETFDEAFKSRIHVPLKYDNLTLESRKQIWKTFIGKLESDGVDLNEKGFNKLAEADMNGRQIKNVIRTAKSLAQFHGQKLDLKKLKQAIDIQKEFENKMDLMTAGIV